MADQNGRQTANIEGNNKNHFLHHFVSNILLQESIRLDFKIWLYTAWTQETADWPQYVVKGHTIYQN